MAAGAVISGDDRRLSRVLGGMEAAARGRVVDDGKRRAALLFARLVRAEFQLSVGPTGKAWRKLKHPRGRGRPNRGGPLYDSGRLRREAGAVQVTAEGLGITVTRDGAVVHLYGGRRIPARPFLPVGRLPAPWSGALAVAFGAALRGVFR